MFISLSSTSLRRCRSVTITGLFTVLLSSASLGSLPSKIAIAQTASPTIKNVTDTSGEPLTFELSSDNFDAYLILLSLTGEPIAEDDDGGEGTNFHLTLTLPTKDTYTLIANSDGVGDTGSYQLHTRPATAPEPTLAQMNQLNQQVNSLYQAGHYSEAIPLAEEALAINEAALGPNHPDTVVSLNNLALLYDSQGRYEEAEPLYLQALEIRESVLGPNHPDTAVSLNNLALMYEFQGRYREAEPLFQRALEIRESALGSDHPYTATTLNGLALLYDAQGRYGEAEPLYQRSLEILESTLGPTHPNTALTLNNLAALYHLQGRYEEAEPLYLRTLSIQESVLDPAHPDTANSLNNLAALYEAQGRYGEAEPLFQRVLEIRESALGPDHPLTASSLNNLAALYDSQGRYEEAEPLYQRSLEIRESALGPDHHYTATGLNNLAALYRSQGRYGEAEPLFQRVLEIRESALGPDHPATAQSLNQLSLQYHIQGQLQSALSYLSRGIAVEETVLSRNLVGGDDANKRDYLATVSGTTDTAISLHLNDLPTDEEAAQLAFSTLLQRKGRILDIFTNLRNQLDDDPAALVLFDDLNAVNSQLSALNNNPPNDPSALAAYETQLRELQQRSRDLTDQLSRLSPDFAALAASPTVMDIQATLPPATALVEFIRYRPLNPTAPEQSRVGEYRYAAYVLQPDGTLQGIDLGPAAAIETAVETFSRDLATAGSPIGQVKASAQALDTLVMAPVHEVLGDTTTVFIAPNGVLNLIPFEALVNDSGNYLVEQYQFRYLTSGRDLMRLDITPASPSSALLVGNPTYGRPGALAAQADTRTIDFANRIFPALPGTQVEVEQIATLLGADPYTTTNATEAVIKQTPQPSILHIATHGFFEPATETLNPLLQSGLILAGAAVGGQSGPEQDGILTALEVTGLNLRGTQLVVLSACETGVGTLAAGEGVYGLRRALVLAGSQSQVISLWKVDDTATQELMVAYYERLLTGRHRDAALRETQLAFLQSSEYRHPYYWAAFIASGNWRPLPPSAGFTP
ncbi:MAG: CHAT domain-containing tetratricopeptide repeat protein [Cyanobacteria bacterium P01_A01_bin.123]